MFNVFCINLELFIYNLILGKANQRVKKKIFLTIENSNPGKELHGAGFAILEMFQTLTKGNMMVSLSLCISNDIQWQLIFYDWYWCPIMASWRRLVIIISSLSVTGRQELFTLWCLANTDPHSKTFVIFHSSQRQHCHICYYIKCMLAAMYFEYVWWQQCP